LKEINPVNRIARPDVQTLLPTLTVKLDPLGMTLNRNIRNATELLTILTMILKWAGPHANVHIIHDSLSLIH
jgi:hypothetical protein